MTTRYFDTDCREDIQEMTSLTHNSHLSETIPRMLCWLGGTYDGKNPSKISQPTAMLLTKCTFWFEVVREHLCTKRWIENLSMSTCLRGLVKIGKTQNQEWSSTTGSLLCTNDEVKLICWVPLFYGWVWKKMTASYLKRSLIQHLEVTRKLDALTGTL